MLYGDYSDYSSGGGGVGSALTPRYREDHLETKGWPPKVEGPTCAEVLTVEAIAAFRDY